MQTAGDLGALEGAVCQLVGRSQDMAALLHHHGAGAGVWDLVLCAGMGLRPGAAARAMVHYLLLRLPKEILDTAIQCLTISDC